MYGAVLPLYDARMVVVGTLAVVVAGWVVWAFNRLVRLRQLMREAWSGVQVQLERRHDLIPNLVETVKGYRDYERTLLEHITTLRSQCLAIEQVRPRGETETELSRSLKNLMVWVEAYPDLKANENFLELQKTLVSIEDDIQMARRYYNGTVRDLSTAVQTFPSLLVARAGGFRPADYFELESATQAAVPEVAL